jgi:hypothetical protein
MSEISTLNIFGDVLNLCGICVTVLVSRIFDIPVSCMKKYIYIVVSYAYKQKFYLFGLNCVDKIKDNFCKICFSGLLECDGMSLGISQHCERS